MGPTLEESFIAQQGDGQGVETNTSGSGIIHMNQRKRQFPDDGTHGHSNRRSDSVNLSSTFRIRAQTSARRHDPSVYEQSRRVIHLSCLGISASKS